MNKDLVLSKSAKGLEAISRRTQSLAPRLRTLLIMVDGKRSVAELLPLAAGLGQPEELLAQLQEAGFVESHLPAATGLPAPATAVVAQRPPEVSLAEAKRFAVRQLTDLLGPTAEMLCLRIEGARTAGDLDDNLQRARIAVRNVRGENTAMLFASAVESHRPSLH